MDIKKKAGEKPFIIQNAVFGVILIALFVFVCHLFSPFWTVLLWSTVLYIIVSPLHTFIIDRLKVTGIVGIVLKNIIALIFALLIALLILLPVLFVAAKLVTQGLALIRSARDYLQSNPQVVNTVLQKISALTEEVSGGQIVWEAADIQNRFAGFLSSIIQTIVRYSTNLAMNISGFIASLAFMVFCLFFFFLDAKRLTVFFSNIPIKKEYMQLLMDKFKITTRNLFFGYILVGVVQSVLAFIVYSIFQIKGALVFACLTFICVYIPIVGGALVWLPLGIAQIMTHGLSNGIVFLAVAATVISLLDNILRPYFLQDRIKLHPFIIFLSLLGGVAKFGFNGIVIGPLVVIFFLTVLEMFLVEHNIEYTETNFKE